VGALDEDNKPAKWNPSDVKVYAPGVNIAFPRGEYDAMAMASGTSCAAPAIAGLVALKIQFEKNKKALLGNRDDDHDIKQVLGGSPKLRFSDMVEMFKKMVTEPRDKPRVLDPCNYFKKECRVDIE
jgi:hypothetical protein